MATVYLAQDRKHDRAVAIKVLEARRAQTYTTALSLAYVYTKLGMRDRALQWAGKAFDERNAFVFAGAMYPGMERLGSDPEYAALLAKARTESLATLRVDMHA